MDGGQLVGRVKHYFPKISVAVVELSDTLRIGDRVVIRKGDHVFEQTVDSMQIDRAPVEEARAGQMIGLKVAEPVKEGYEVYRVQ